MSDDYEAPDKVQFTNWGRVYSTSWGYQIRNGSSNGDSAVSAIWNLSDLNPGESREYVTYYGLSELEGNLLPPLALAISADSVMTYDGENMPKQDVIGYVQNISGATYSGEYDVRFWGYDWRRDISDIALDLEAFIEDESYSDVILVCHSMGGLVASKYLANGTDNQEKVEKLITMGTPYLGAPKALYVFETGHLLEWVKSTFCMATPIKAVANNFTSVYELLPTENYFDLNDTTYVQYQNNNGFLKKKTTEKYDYDQTKKLISERSWATGKGFLNTAESFAETLFVDGEHITNNVDSYYIIGYNKDTILEVEEEYNKNGTFDSCRELTIANGGDETVPVISANIGGTADEDKTYYIQETHTGLVKNDDILDLVENIIADKADQYESTISKTCPEEINEKGWLGFDKTIRIQLKIECPVD